MLMGNYTLNNPKPANINLLEKRLPAIKMGQIPVLTLHGIVVYTGGSNDP